MSEHPSSSGECEGENWTTGLIDAVMREVDRIRAASGLSSNEEALANVNAPR